MVALSSCGRCAQHLIRIRGRDTRIRRESGEYVTEMLHAKFAECASCSPRIIQMLRAPAARGPLVHVQVHVHVHVHEYITSLKAQCRFYWKMQYNDLCCHKCSEMSYATYSDWRYNQIGTTSKLEWIKNTCFKKVAYYADWFRKMDHLTSADWLKTTTWIILKYRPRKDGAWTGFFVICEKI
jgi:hypothetical protein